MKRIVPLIGLIVLSMSVVSCHKNPVTGKSQFGVMSEEREIALGQSYDPQVVAQFGLYESERLQGYIDQEGQKMAAISHRPDLAYTFRIVDSPIINAFAVPGGFVYFTRGIMAHFNNEAEFAGVLGHEIGHITARHSVVQQRNATLAQVGLIAGMIASPEIAQMAMQTQSLELLMLKFGRDAESQSDELGVEYSSEVGYDAHEMADFFNTLARKGEESGVGRIPEFMSTHPDPNNRRERVKELASEWQAQHNAGNLEVGRDKYLSMLDGLTYGEDPRQGFVENWTFYHPDLKFTLPVPNGWRYQNSPQAFQMAPEDGKAAITLTAGSAEGTLQATAQQFAQEVKLTLSNSAPASLNGMSTYIIEGTTTPESQDEQAVRARIIFIDYGGLRYQIVGVSLVADFPSFSTSIDNCLRNFKTLTDQDKLSRQPEKLKVVTINSSGTLQSALQSQGVPSDRLTEFSILNGMTLDAPITSGTKIKVVQDFGGNTAPVQTTNLRKGDLQPRKGSTAAPNTKGTKTKTDKKSSGGSLASPDPKVKTSTKGKKQSSGGTLQKKD